MAKIKYDKPASVPNQYEDKAKLYIFAAVDDSERRLSTKTRASYQPAGIKLKDVWDFNTGKLKTTSWQLAMKTGSKASVQQHAKAQDIADDMFNQCWQDNNPLLQDMSIFGMSQDAEVSLVTYGQLADVIEDSIRDGDNVHIKIHMFEDLTYNHVTSSSSAAAAASGTPSLPLPKNITCEGTQLSNRLDVNPTVNENAWHKFPPKFPSDIKDLKSWWQSMMAHANANGIPWPSWHSIARNNKMGDVIDSNLSFEVRQAKDIASQHVANLFRQEGCFPKQTRDYCLAATLAGNDGCQALYNIADRSLLHPNLKTTKVQTTIPHQTATMSFTELAVTMLDFVQTEAGSFRYYSQRDHSDLIFNSIHPSYRDAFQARYTRDMDAHSDKSTSPTPLSPEQLPFTLEKWKTELKIEVKSHAPPHLRQIQEAASENTVALPEAAQLCQLAIADHQQQEETDVDDICALGQAEADQYCGYCGLPGHTKPNCTRMINHCIINQQMKDNPTDAAAILKKHTKIVTPRRNNRTPSQGRGMQSGRGTQSGRGNRQRTRVADRVRQLHEVLTSQSAQLAMSQIPDASPPHADDGDAVSI